MTYIKTLIILTGLALLTACAGGVTINPTVNNNTIVVPCETNPYGAPCGGEKKPPPLFNFFPFLCPVGAGVFLGCDHICLHG